MSSSTSGRPGTARAASTSPFSRLRMPSPWLSGSRRSSTVASPSSSNARATARVARAAMPPAPMAAGQTTTVAKPSSTVPRISEDPMPRCSAASPGRPRRRDRRRSPSGTASARPSSATVATARSSARHMLPLRASQPASRASSRDCSA
ncbi:hypothetical protein NF552_10470 [Roseomonas mucosa]|nr:hypothetical protein NF552_10470 [Roseomonas mucosa]